MFLGEVLCVAAIGICFEWQATIDFDTCYFDRIKVGL